ncbi:MAG: hypothetical protein IJ685_09640, partial [Selenomonadaceae bacterium]|nr:hypothetical protein [Selenomonadaceae bacterium]
MALKSVDLPTFGKPTIPTSRLLMKFLPPKIFYVRARRQRLSCDNVAARQLFGYFLKVTVDLPTFGSPTIPTSRLLMKLFPPKFFLFECNEQLMLSKRPNKFDATERCFFVKSKAGKFFRQAKIFYEVIDVGKIFQSTPAYRKGLIGEEIIQKFLEFRGCTVSRPKDTAPTGSSTIDFVLNAPKKFSLWKGTELAEVKVRTTGDYSYGRFPVYIFPTSQFENYRRYAAEKNLHLNIFVVDPEREQIFWRDLDELETPLRVEEKTFPVDVEQSNGLHRYYHVKQFVPVGRPNFTDLERLRSINLSHAEPKILRPLTDVDEEFSDEEILSESRAAVKNFLDVTLPDDLPASDEKIDAFTAALRSSLRRIPTYRFREIYHAVRNLNAVDEMPAFAKKFYLLLDDIKRERQRASYLTPYIFKPKTSAKKFAELHAPGDTIVEIFALEKEPKLFAEMFHVATAFGCDTRGLIHSDFGNAVKATSRFYTLNFGSTDKKISAVPVKDVPAILRDYAFNRTDDAEKFLNAKNFLSWWK